jgi:hypothetical protein
MPLSLDRTRISTYQQHNRSQLKMSHSQKLHLRIGHADLRTVKTHPIMPKYPPRTRSKIITPRSSSIARLNHPYILSHPPLAYAKKKDTRNASQVA